MSRHSEITVVLHDDAQRQVLYDDIEALLHDRGADFTISLHGFGDRPRPVKTPELAEDQVWLPTEGPAYARTIYALSTTSVSFSIPERCPSCNTLIHTETESSRSCLRSEFLEWIASEGATLFETQHLGDGSR